jgi:hypothetical protein
MHVTLPCPFLQVRITITDKDMCTTAFKDGKVGLPSVLDGDARFCLVSSEYVAVPGCSIGIGQGEGTASEDKINWAVPVTPAISLLSVLGLLQMLLDARPSVDMNVRQLRFSNAGVCANVLSE